MAAVRAATRADAAACAALYRPYVLHSAVTFETDPPGVGELARRIAAAHRWLVVVQDGRVLGYAYGAGFRERPAYRSTVEVSVYLAQGHAGRGLGRLLYAALLQGLTDDGFRLAVAGMTLPNDASQALHASLGFVPVGIYRGVGHKLGAWHDVAWVQRRLGAGVDAPPSR